ncbi:MAG: hypothetical protein BGO41_10650 [Clostridiales bacterium 38-18]|nr:MAG: hypothetical protein BGO41_10650 [Clostridiales bacterium 38-18]
MNIKIITDSCCDLPLNFVESHSDLLHVLGMPIQIQNREVIDDLGKTYKHKDFYDLLRQGIMPTTSQINSYRFECAFRDCVKEGKEVIYLGFTSGMSGTYNSAMLAKQTVLEDYPEAVIQIVDTLSASIGQGTIIVEALKLVNQGKNANEIAEWAESVKLSTHHWFGVDDLNYLKNGGRISHFSALVGSMLNVKPTLGVGNDGRIKPFGNVRGRKKSIAQLASKFEAHYQKSSHSAVIVGHGNCEADALALADAIKEIDPEITLIISELSMTIASHVGPNMIAVAFIGDEREE